MRFLYKQEGTTYEQLLSATWEAETKVTEGKGVAPKSTAATMRTSENLAIQDICECIDCLTATLKSASLVGGKPKGGNCNNQGTVKKKLGAPPNNPVDNSPGKIYVPGTSVAGPFRSGQHPMQCHTCGAGVMDGASVPCWETSPGGSTVGQSPLDMPKTQTQNKSS